MSQKNDEEIQPENQAFRGLHDGLWHQLRAGEAGGVRMMGMGWNGNIAVSPNGQSSQGGEVLSRII